MSRWTSAAAVVGFLVVATVAACGDDSGSPVVDTPTSTERGPTTTASTEDAAPTTATAPPDDETVIEVTIAGGRPEGGVRTERVTLGDTVVLRVTSDVADEVHVHSYDVRVAVVPGAPAELRFTADVPGVFEVELEERHRQILELEVRPG